MEELDLKAIYTMLCRKKVVVILVILVSMLIGGLYSYKLVVPKYKSSTTLILGRIIDSTDIQNLDVDNKITQSEIAINSNLVSTYSELIKSKTLIKKVKSNLNINIDEEMFRDAITVSRIAETELIEITVENESPEMASVIANEIAKVFSEKIQEIYNIKNVYIIDEAIPELEPYNINHIKDISVFTVLGLIISFGILILYSVLDTTIKSVDDIENDIGLKNLNIIPIRKQDLKSNSKNTELITYEDSKSVTAEAFRTLRTNIQFSNINNKENKILLLTSCFSSEGKSYVSANLAVAFAQAGKKVILIDADMRRGRQAKIFNIPNELGLSNYLSNLDKNGMEISERINKYINETEVKNLNVITSGNIPPNPTELLTSNRLPELVKELGVFYDLVIFDGAPILPIADSLILARMANSTVLVSLFNKTKKDELLKAKKDIQNIGGRIIGTVLNKVPMSDYEYSSKYYYSNNDDTNSFFKKSQIRKQIKKEKIEKRKNEFKGLNFDREKNKRRNKKVKIKFTFNTNVYKVKINDIKNKIKDFLNRFKKEETKLLDMSKTEKEIYIRNQKKERQIQIRKKKEALKEQRRKERQELLSSKKEENVKGDSSNINDNAIKANQSEKISFQEINEKSIKNKEENKENLKNNNDNLTKESIKLKSEENLNKKIHDIEENIKKQSDNLEKENNVSEIGGSSENEDNNKKEYDIKNKIKEKYDVASEKVKTFLTNSKTELKDLKEKLAEEFKNKRMENLEKKLEKKAARDAYNSRKAADKAEKDALRKEEYLKYKQIRDEERAKQEVVKQEEKKMKAAERALRKQERENEKRELAQKKMAQKGLREAEKENRKNKKEALRLKQKEEARIKEELLEDNLYPKTKYNKDL